MEQYFKDFVYNSTLNISGTDRIEYGFDTHGRVVMRTNNQKRPNMSQDPSLKFFDGCDFITIDREDAENILDMLNEAIRRLESRNRSDNDVEVFGDKAISYERLIDALNHTTYPKKED